MKKRKLLFVAIASLLGGMFVSFCLWQHGQSRREAVIAVTHLAKCLASPNGSDLLDAVMMPIAVQSQTPSEQKEFLVKALSDEISLDAVLALKRHATFGPAKLLFPKESLLWCQQAGVNVDNCVAFKMRRAGIEAEVVLLREGKTYRVVRCNNVKQMAGEG